MTGCLGKEELAIYTWLKYVFQRQTLPVNHTSLARPGLKHLELETAIGIGHVHCLVMTEK